MYIGSTTSTDLEGFVLGKWRKYSIVPGLLKIIDEIIDNSIDEFTRSEGKHATKISVEVDPDGKITVSDNGRGIPVEKHEGHYRPYLCWGAARAGTSFGSERDTIGAHGLGSFLSNVFSTEFIGVSCDGDKTYIGEWKNGKLVSEKVKGGGKNGVQVTFTPDYAYFGYTSPPDVLAELLRDRISHLSATYPDVKFKFNGDDIRFRDAKELADLYVTEENRIMFEDDNVVIVFGPAGNDEEFRFSSHVNGLNLRHGGSQVDYVMNMLITELRPHLKRKYKLEVLPNAIRQHLMMVQIVRKMKNLKFKSQTKEELTNSPAEIKEAVGDIRFDLIAHHMMKIDAVVKPMVEALLFKKELEEAKLVAQQQKVKTKFRGANYIAATAKNPKDRILFIAEGDSALGRLREVRVADFHGGYALRGKVMNTREMRPLEIVKNKELSEVMQILNLKFGQKADDLNYGRIGILTDADVDGQSIMCLLINFFANWPELFTNGHVFRVETPLIIAKKGKEEKRYYSLDEFGKDKLDEKWNIEYFKGLGSLSTDEYRLAINQPRLLRIEANSPSDFKKLDMAFGPDADVRKTWMLQ